MKALDRLRRVFSRKTYLRDIDHGGWVDTSAPWNFWQTGYSQSNGLNAVVYACVQAYAQTIAQLPGKHLKKQSGGWYDEIENSPLTQIMARPNTYQTRSDFLLNLVTSLLYEGNSYALAVRDAQFRITQLHLLPSRGCSPTVAGNGEIFYSVSPESVTGIPGGLMVPQRDILHVRLHTPHDPLRGETPIYAAAQAVNINNNIAGHLSNFFSNMARPSGVITTDEKLTADQTQELRTRWDEMTKGLNSGKVPILSWGLKWQPLSLTSTDAEIIAAMKMSTEDIARAFRVPLPIIGSEDNATYNNVFNLLAHWKSSGLGFVIEHIEQALTALFELPIGERLELDTNRLLRTDDKSRIEALTQGVTGGLYAPNEARLMEGLSPVDGGDMPRVQQQMVPLNYEEPQPDMPAPSLEELTAGIGELRTCKIKIH